MKKSHRHATPALDPGRLDPGAHPDVRGERCCRASLHPRPL